MPRHARERSFSGVYHVTLRGINRQDLFEDNADYSEFVGILKKCKTISKYEVYAYCLMSDHVHLLLRTTEEEIGLVMKRITVRYVMYYNHKYERTGHLFQNRYGSERVENEQYLLTAWRYILQNPMKAGMEMCPGHYKWSSFFAYNGKEDHVTDTEMIKTLLPERNEMMSFLQCPNEDMCLEYASAQDYVKTDRAAFEKMRTLCGCSTTTEFQKLEKGKRNEGFIKLYQNGLSVRQINRITGANRKTIDRVISQVKIT